MSIHRPVPVRLLNPDGPKVLPEMCEKPTAAFSAMTPRAIICRETSTTAQRLARPINTVPRRRRYRPNTPIACLGPRPPSHSITRVCFSLTRVLFTRLRTAAAFVGFFFFPRVLRVGGIGEKKTRGKNNREIFSLVFHEYVYLLLL